MEKLVELVVEAAGISTDQARIAVEVLVGYLTSEVSEPCRDEIESKFGIMSLPDTKMGILAAVAEKAGITQDQAEAAAKAVNEYLQGQVSAPCGNEIESRFTRF